MMRLCFLCDTLGPQNYIGFKKYCQLCYPSYRQALSSFKQGGRGGNFPATKAVERAKSQGLLRQLDGRIMCEYCEDEPAKHYEHRDYNEPLEVIPVCRSCNFRIGPAKYHVDCPDDIEQKALYFLRTKFQERALTILMVGNVIPVRRPCCSEMIN